MKCDAFTLLVRKLYAVRISILPLVGVLVVSCAGPQQATQPEAVSGPASAPDVAAAPQPSNAAAAKPDAPAPASASKDEARANTPTPEEDAAPLPEGFVAIEHPFHDGKNESRSALCGKLRVENVRGDPEAYEPFVVVTDTTTGKKIYEAHGRRYDMSGQTMRMELTASACGDVTGDGVAELLLTEKTLGAHCCYTHYVTSMTSPTKLIMTWDKGDSGDGIWPMKLKPGPAWQIQSVAVVPLPFDVAEGDPAVAYAFAPSFPIVFDLIGGKYQKRTFAFLDVLRKERDLAREACAKRPECEAYDLYEWGMAVMFDEWETEREKIVPQDEALRERLDVRALEMKKRMRAQLGG